MTIDLLSKKSLFFYFFYFISCICWSAPQVPWLLSHQEGRTVCPRQRSSELAKWHGLWKLQLRVCLCLEMEVPAKVIVVRREGNQNCITGFTSQ
ncbi:hypothetical protein J3Q64DRAFT_1770322 [Phycomyces blakesleeanus]|uniref:Secreted protein n=1 Tax=Phycomyces blakesleeanus TaxID=4837 RepID=A0ABR3ALJ0_PHYBL